MLKIRVNISWVNSYLSWTILTAATKLGCKICSSLNLSILNSEKFPSPPLFCDGLIFSGMIFQHRNTSAFAK